MTFVFLIYPENVYQYLDFQYSFHNRGSVLFMCIHWFFCVLKRACFASIRVVQDVT